jgi:hypothetical protein
MSPIFLRLKEPRMFTILRLRNIVGTFTSTHNLDNATFEKLVEEKDPQFTFKETKTEVLSVDPTKIKLQTKTDDKKTVETIDYSLCFWLTGVSPNPLVAKLKSKNPSTFFLVFFVTFAESQTNNTALLTNEFMGVKGFEDIYAVGDCATTDQSKLLSKWDRDIFEKLDENKDGFIDFEEFQHFTTLYAKKYPQILYYAQYAKDVFDSADVNHDGKLSPDEFKVTSYHYHSYSI